MGWIYWLAGGVIGYFLALAERLALVVIGVVGCRTDRKIESRADALVDWNGEAGALVFELNLVAFQIAKIVIVVIVDSANF